jgi:NAD(P)-dependent dehydrogenase (short-subunit alcohol dehydrogenase family)
MQLLKDRVAIITGGASGIGLAAAKLYVEQGAQVVITDLSEDSLQRALAEIDSDGCVGIRANATSMEDNLAMVAKAVEAFGGVDILLANAGVDGKGLPLLEADPSSLDFPLEVNVKGPFLGAKAAVPEMIKRGGGSIVITSSIAAVLGKKIDYGTSKHAVTGLMRSLALDLAKHRIRVNAVGPGPVSTPMMEEALQGEFRKQYLATIPLGHFGETIDIANAMLFLTSDMGKWITGQNLFVDGGITMT